MKTNAHGLALSLPILLVACSDHSRSAPGAGVVKPVSFQTREEIPVGIPGVADATLADLNGDSRPDLAVTGLGDQAKVLLGQGNGTFLLGQTISTPGLPVKIKAADLDADGDVDLAVLRSVAERISILRNDGAANFALASELTTLPFPDEIVLGDCDGDGRVDVSLACLQVSDVMLFAGQGNGTFAPATNVVLPPLSTPSALAVADVDGDGLGDLLVGEKQRGELLVLPALPGGGHAAARAFSVGAFPLSIGTGDLDRDGRTDIAVSCYLGQSVSILLAQGTGYSLGTIPVDGNPGNILVADVNGDALVDLTLTVFDRGCVSVFLGLASGALGPEVQMSASGLPYRPLAGDIDADGQADLLVSAGGQDRVNLYRARSGRLNGAINFETGIAAPEFVTSADFDGDGQAEMATAGRGGSQVAILGFRPDPVLGTAAVPLATIDVGRPCYNVVKGDFNGDGRPDVAVNTDLGVKILANVRGSATALALAPIPSAPDQVLAGGIGPFELAAEDMDGDGLTDLVLTDVFAQTVTVLRANSRGFTYDAFPVRVPVSGTPVGIAIADYTGDRLPDVAVTRNAQALVTVLRNDGTGRVEPHLDIPVAGGPSYLRTADFDRNGRMDLVVSNSAADQVTVLLSLPGGFAPLTFAAGSVPTALLAQDLNGDGAADILVASLVGADFRVMLGDGRGGFPVQLAFPGTYKATSADLADVDGDGRIDLALASVETTRLSVYRNNSQ